MYIASHFGDNLLVIIRLSLLSERPIERLSAIGSFRQGASIYNCTHGTGPMGEGGQHICETKGIAGLMDAYFLC